MTDNGMFSIKDWVEQVSQFKHPAIGWDIWLTLLPLLLVVLGLFMLFISGEIKEAKQGLVRWVGSISFCVGIVLYIGDTVFAFMNGEDSPDAPTTFKELVSERTGVSDLRCESPTPEYGGWFLTGDDVPHDIDLDVYDVPAYDIMTCSFATGDGRVFSNGSLRVDSDNWLVGLYGADGNPIAAKEGGDD